MIHAVAVGQHHIDRYGIGIINIFHIAFRTKPQIYTSGSPAETFLFPGFGLTLTVVALFQILLKCMASYSYLYTCNLHAGLLKVFLKHLQLAFKSRFYRLALGGELGAHAAVLTGKVKSHIPKARGMEHHLKTAHVFLDMRLYLVSHLIKDILRIGSISDLLTHFTQRIGVDLCILIRIRDKYRLVFPELVKFGTFTFFGPMDRYGAVIFSLSAPAFGTPDFTLPAGLTAIEANAFEGVRAAVVEIPSGCAAIGGQALRTA